MKILQTVTGNVPATELGMILPHEHLFTDLRGPEVLGYAVGDPEKVAEVMKPFLEDAYQHGITALVECSTVGVGRNIPVLQRISETTAIKIVAPTGVYRDAYIPASLRTITAEELAERWIGDLTQGIREKPTDDPFPVKAGFIKIAMSDDAITTLEARNLKAAAIASRVTGSAVASHTIHGWIAMREMDLLEAEGMDLNRFVWVHANAEPAQKFHLEAARRGAYVEFDAIGSSEQADLEQLQYVLTMVQAGYESQVLLSHDAGWYNPGHPQGKPSDEGIRGYTALVIRFLPMLKEHGVSDELIKLMTQINPARAFRIAEK